MLEDSNAGFLGYLFVGHVSACGPGVPKCPTHLLSASQKESLEGQTQAVWLFIVLLCKLHGAIFTSFQKLELCC